MEVSPALVRERVEWRSATTTLMVVCVTTSLMRMLQQLSAMEMVISYVLVLQTTFTYSIHSFFLPLAAQMQVFCLTYLIVM